MDVSSTAKMIVLLNVNGDVRELVLRHAMVVPHINITEREVVIPENHNIKNCLYSQTFHTYRYYCLTTNFVHYED